MTVRRLFLAAALGLIAVPAAAQDPAAVTPITAPAEPGAIALGTGGVPGATASESWFRQWGSPMARNVTAATLTPVLPAKGKATGAAVIVAPGGAGMWLSMDNEGWTVARMLAKQGIAAFVLKYRLRQTPAGTADFAQLQNDTFAGIGRPEARLNPNAAVQGMRLQIEDARAAFALIRARSRDWKVDPARVGMLGFSAGAMATMATTLGAPEVKPAFIAPIYGSMEAVKVPADAPPMFAVLAADDELFARKGLGLIDAWQTAKRPVEFHLYQAGGHGFGPGKKGTTSTGWLPAFVAWLDAGGFLTPAR